MKWTNLSTVINRRTDETTRDKYLQEHRRDYDNDDANVVEGRVRRRLAVHLDVLPPVAL